MVFNLIVSIKIIQLRHHIIIHRIVFLFYLFVYQYIYEDILFFVQNLPTDHVELEVSYGENSSSEVIRTIGPTLRL